MSARIARVGRRFVDFIRRRRIMDLDCHILTSFLPVYTSALLKWTAFGTFSARVRTPRQPYSPKLVGDLAVKCGTYSGTRNGRPVMGLSSSAVKAGAGRGAVGSSAIRHAEHTMIVTTGRRARTVHY